MDISFEEFKKRLGNRGNEMSDSEIERVLSILTELADIAFPDWNNPNTNE